jgi:membrane-associated phospholipid phosphatase
MRLALGSLLTLVGFLHLLPEVAALDLALARTIQDISDNQTVRIFFRQIWFLGRTYFSVLFLVFLTAANWKYGISASMFFLAGAGLERLIKVTINRRRPFQQSSAIRMYQPVQPDDPSFPSGDCLRIWFIVLLIPALVGYTGFLLAVCILLGIAVSLGRMVMGVHFLSDVLSGTGLGILTAGAVLYFWHFIIF